MSLLSDMKPPTRKRRCFVADTAAELKKEDAEILYAAIASPDWGLQALSTALSERGVQLSRSTLERHRKGLCGCLKN